MILAQGRACLDIKTRSWDLDFARTFIKEYLSLRGTFVLRGDAYLLDTYSRAFLFLKVLLVYYFNSKDIMTLVSAQ